MMRWRFARVLLTSAIGHSRCNEKRRQRKMATVPICLCLVSREGRAETRDRSYAQRARDQILLDLRRPRVQPSADRVTEIPLGLVLDGVAIPAQNLNHVER